MDTNFWHERWRQNEIGFHEPNANPLLTKNFPELSLAKGSRIFVPLCGKTLDIRWLLSQGYRVAGAELSGLAIDQLFAELGVTPAISEAGKLRHYGAPGIDIFVGNIFDVTGEILGAVDAIYDRAALVALPPEIRVRYTAHLMEITRRAPQLLICFEYDQTLVEGPPFSISDEEVNRHYGKSYTLTLLSTTDVVGGLKGKYPAREHVYRLSPLEKS
jgi:thiopurine S-methyltransferase